MYILPNFFHLMHHKWRGNTIFKAENFLLLAFYHIIWGLENIQYDLFYLKYLQRGISGPTPAKQPLYAFSFNLLNWEKAIILNVVGKHVGKMYFWRNVYIRDYIPSWWCFLDKVWDCSSHCCGSDPQQLRYFLLFLSSHRSQLWSHPLIMISIKSSMYLTINAL